MRRIEYLVSILVVVLGQAFACSSAADTFGIGANAFQIEFVTIGEPGNPPDTTDRPVTDGAVPYKFRMGKYEISEQMIDKANALGGLGITKDTRGPNMPATSISWFEAARFVNWLNTNSGEMPAYKFDTSGNSQLWQPTDLGYDPANLYRNTLARYFLPSLNEWHKAAYYDPVAGVYYDYPTGSDTVPDGIDFAGDPNFDAVFYDGALNSDPTTITNAGLLSPSSTLGQGGNVDEWVETAADRINSSTSEQRIRHGGSWVDGSTLLLASNPSSAAPFGERPYSGFRVASVVPEPTSVSLTASGIMGLLTIFTSQLRLMKRFRIILTVMLLSALFVQTVRAEVIYNQTIPSSPIGASSSNDAGSVTDQKIADNFLLTGPDPATIRSLRFIGGYGLTSPPPQTPPLDALPTDNFRVVFLTDSAGAPGLPVPDGDFHVGLPIWRTPTGGPLLNGVVTPLEYVLDLGAGISVSPSAAYWISIVNNPGSNYFWAWARGAGVFDQKVASTFGDVKTGPWTVFTTGGMYFELNDENVPEPGFLRIFLSACCGVWWLRLRRHPRT